jgi:hypothetical protein
MLQNLNELISEMRDKLLAGYDSGRVRKAIYLTIARTHDRRFITTLCHRMVENHYDYSYAAEALLEYESEGARVLLKVVISAIKSGIDINHYVLTRLCRMLLKYEIKNTSEIKPLINRCFESRSKRCRLAAVALVNHYHLVEFVEPLEKLTYKLKDDSEEFHLLLATLGKFGCPSSEPIFKEIIDAQSDKTIDESNPYMIHFLISRTWDIVFAFLFLAKRGSQNVIPMIETFFNEKIPNGEELVIVSKALAEFAIIDPKLISSCINSKDELLRGSAAWALGWAGTEAAMEECKTLLSVEQSPYVAYCAASAMGKVRSTKYVGNLKTLLKEGSTWCHAV